MFSSPQRATRQRGQGVLEMAADRHLKRTIIFNKRFELHSSPLLPRMLALLPVSALLTICRADPGPAVQHHPGSTYCANGGYCVPNVLCAPDYMRNLYQPGASCYLAHGTPGICCLERKSSCEIKISDQSFVEHYNIFLHFFH